MRLNKETLRRVLEIAAEKGEAGFEEKDILPLFHNNEYDLIFHLDYLTEKGFIDGEFSEGAYAAFAILPKPIHFLNGKITAKGKEYLTGLKEPETATATAE